MKGVIETFMGVIVIALMAVLATGYISASINTRNAQNFHSAVISEIEASNFSDEVIALCEAKALENGFTVTNEAGELVSGLKIVKMEHVDMVEVTLTYQYSIPVLNSFLEHEIVGYAR